MRPRHMVRGVLAIALLVGVYVLALVVAVVLVGGVVVAVTLAVRNDVSVGALIGKFGVAALITVVAMGRGLWKALRRRPVGQPVGVQVTAEDQPRLWSEVTEIAEQVGTRAPDEIWLRGDVNAAVSEDTRMLGLRGGTRRMFVGVPLLLALSRSELRSVLAHELGHYGGRHTALGPVTYRGAESLARVTEELQRDTITGRIFMAYARLYFRVSLSVRRQQEFEADLTSVRIAGPGAAASALREVHVAGAAWAYFVDTHVARGQQVGLLPVGLFPAFAAMLRDPALQDELAAFRARTDWPSSGRYDSHPSLPERLAAIAGYPSAEMPELEGTALRILSDPESTLTAVESSLFEGSGMRSAPWLEIARVAGVEWATSTTRALERAAAAFEPDDGVTPGEVLEVLRRGHAVTLMDPLLPEDATRQDRHDVAVEIVFGYLALALVQQERARFDVSWAGSWPLVDMEGTTIGLLELVGRAVRRDVAPLEHVLRELDLDLDRRVEVPTEDAGDSPAWVLGVLSHLTMGMRYVHLVLLDTGLLVVPLPRRDVMTVGLRIAFTSATAEKEAHQVASTGVAELMARPGARFVRWSEITDGRVRKGFRRVRLRLRIADGARFKIDTAAVSGVAGEPWRVLGAHVGDRLDWKV